MQRILFCTDFLLAGGVERQLTELITHLDTADFEVQVICLYGDKAGKSLHFKEQINAQNIPVQVLNLGNSFLAKIKGLWAIWLASWRFRPHIIHAVNYHSNLLTRIIRPLLPLSTNLIGAVRVEYTPKQLRYERLSHWACRKIVCNSPHIQKQLIHTASIPPQKVCMIPNGVDIERFRNTTLKHSEIVPASKRIFLSVGRISNQKAQHQLIQAFGQLNQSQRLHNDDCHLILLGEIEDDDIQDNINRSINLYNLSEIISQHPSTSNPEHYFKASDVTLLFSDYEGLPNVALESLAAGKPVIISEAANASKIIEHSITGWIVRTGDIEHLAETILNVMALPKEKLDQMKAFCQKRAQDFAMEKMIDSYSTLYQSL